MTTLTLNLSTQPIITLPADLARQAGLIAGEIEVIPGRRSLIVVPATSRADYTIRWQAMATVLREQAAEFGFTEEDRRDADYWEIVGPLFDETAHSISSTGS